MNSSTPNGCIFCRIVRHESPAIVTYDSADVLAIMDLYPATRGHMLVVPKQHVESIYAMPGELGARIMATAVELAKEIKRQLSPIGLNLVQSNEAAAGQTIPHFHLHLVPRYRGDSVMLQFGHGTEPADKAELEQLASLVRSALERERRRPAFTP